MSSPADTTAGLSEQQVNFFNAFGFLRLPGYLRDEIDDISAAFDRIFTDAGEPVPAESLEQVSEAFSRGRAVATFDDLNLGTRRIMIPEFLERDPALSWLPGDPRITGLIDSLMPDGHHYNGSDGNIFDGDTAWHCDLYGSPLESFHVKFFVYLDHLDGQSGALRVVIGSSFHESEFADLMRTTLAHRKLIEKNFGIDWKDVPAAVVENEPGDLLIGNYRNVHATVNGGPGRRMFTWGYGEGPAPD